MAANRHSHKLHHDSTADPSGPRRNLGMVSLVGMGIGGIIGAGFFLGSGIVIRQVGPGIVLTYVLAGIILAQVMGAITSLAINVPVRSSYQEYIHRFLGAFAGFLLGWAVFISGVLAIGSEATAMAVYSRTWIPTIPLGIFAVAYVLVIIALNLFGVRDLGKAEALMSVVKSGVLVAFILTAGWVLVGGLPQRHSIALPSGNLWQGVFPHGIGAVFQGMLIVIFSYAGVTTVAMATSRAQHPQATVPKAAWLTTIAVVLLYALSVLALVLLIGYQHLSVHQSPFVTVLARYRLVWFGGIFNAVILIASFSVMAGTFYATEWMLISLALQRGAPKYFRHAGRGRPMAALAATAGMVLATMILAFVLPKTVYTDLTAASSYFTFVNWLLILLAFIVWHRRRGRSEHTVSGLAFGAPYGAIVMAAAILTLGIYSVTVPSFRLGFYVFAGLTVLIVAAWLAAGRTARSTEADGGRQP